LELEEETFSFTFCFSNSSKFLVPDSISFEFWNLARNFSQS
jgi:hypothetical protein